MVREIAAELERSLGDARESTEQAERGFVEATSLLTTVRELQRLESELRYLDVAEIFARGLPAFLSEIQDECNQVGEEIHRAFFFT